MKKFIVIEKTLKLYLEGKTKEAVEFAKHYYPYQDIRNQPNPFESSTESIRVKKVPKNERPKPPSSEYQRIKVYINDCYTDRYSGEKLIFPGAIRILKNELSPAFPVQGNYIVDGTHQIYWELSPGLDHIIPISRLKEGEDSEANWTTTSHYNNSKKSSRNLSEANLVILPKQKGWDGLGELFLEIVKKKPHLLDDNYIKRWNNALLRAKKNGLI